jgi:hypothetical protein
MQKYAKLSAAYIMARRWENVADEYKDGLFRIDFDTLVDNINELAYTEVCWDKVFLFVDVWDI